MKRPAEQCYHTRKRPRLIAPPEDSLQAEIQGLWREIRTEQDTLARQHTIAYACEPHILRQLDMLDTYKALTRPDYWSAKIAPSAQHTVLQTWKAHLKRKITDPPKLSLTDLHTPDEIKLEWNESRREIVTFSRETATDMQYAKAPHSHQPYQDPHGLYYNYDLRPCLTRQDKYLESRERLDFLDWPTLYFKFARVRYPLLYLLNAPTPADDQPLNLPKRVYIPEFTPLTLNQLTGKAYIRNLYALTLLQINAHRADYASHIHHRIQHYYLLLELQDALSSSLEHEEYLVHRCDKTPTRRHAKRLHCANDMPDPHVYSKHAMYESNLAGQLKTTAPNRQAEFKLNERSEVLSLAHMLNIALKTLERICDPLMLIESHRCSNLQNATLHKNYLRLVFKVNQTNSMRSNLLQTYYQHGNHLLTKPASCTWKRAPHLQPLEVTYEWLSQDRSSPPILQLNAWSFEPEVLEELVARNTPAHITTELTLIIDGVHHIQRLDHQHGQKALYKHIPILRPLPELIDLTKK